MVKDYLAKGYPGSARQVVQRMAREGQPAAQDLISVRCQSIIPLQKV